MGLQYLGQAFQGPNGSVGAPAFSFIEDASTGMYLAPPVGDEHNNQLAFAVGGYEYLRVGLTGSGIYTNTMKINAFEIEAPFATIRPAGVKVPDGSASLPRFSFNDDTDTGLYRVGGNTLGISAGGSEKVRVSPNETTIFNFARVYGANQPSAANLALGFIPASGSQYNFYADNAGSGTDNTRLWLDTPNQGQVVIGPRSSGSRLADIRLRANNLYLDTPPYAGSAGFPVAFYRAGTFTPNISTAGNAPAVSYSDRVGNYIRIGNIVWWHALIRFTKSGGSGAVRVGGFPFASSPNVNDRAIGTIAISNSSWPSAGTTQWYTITDTSHTYATIYAIGGGTSYVPVEITNLTNGTTTIYASGFYTTADS